MKQVLQNLRDGTTHIERVPVPMVADRELLIRSTVSLISTGTERMIVEFGKANILDKARQQPDKIKMVLEKARADGILSTIEAVNAKLDTNLPLGYSNVGVVDQVGRNVIGFEPGDRVVSNGHHAEYVAVGEKLCARIPGNVSDEHATFTVAGAIALQGIRLARPTLGECFVVTGLGLIGLLTVQILRANGCRVLGLDVDKEKLKLAELYGAETADVGAGEDPVDRSLAFSRGRGVDSVLITASAKNDEILHQSAEMCRKRARIVLVGVVGLNLRRADFYEKELTFQVSCSYGPGRYDPGYEQQGRDYPIGFVRWTEQRNFEAVLDLLSRRSLDVSKLISARFSIDDAGAAYAKLSDDRSVLGILLQHSENRGPEKSVNRVQELGESSNKKELINTLVVGALGAGNYASRILLPMFSKSGTLLQSIATSKGVSGTLVGKKLGFRESTTDPASIFSNDKINTVVIATRHDSHADYVCDALNSNKNVFVEKPLALNESDLDKIEAAYRRATESGARPILMVGFNRRFAPLIQSIKTQIQKRNQPISMIYTCNAGHIDASAWVQKLDLGGGRVVGEACHFIDLARFLADSKIQDISVMPMRLEEGSQDCRDTVTIALSFENGSLATINYFANGNRAYPKEKLEVFQGGDVMVMDNFRVLKRFGSSQSTTRSFRQNRGQLECIKAFIGAVSGTASAPIPLDEILEVSRTAIRAAELAAR